MKRRFFNILTVLSLLLFVAAAAMWWRSVDVYDAGPFRDATAFVQYDSLHGEFAITWRMKWTTRPRQVVHIVRFYEFEELKGWSFTHDVWPELDGLWRMTKRPRWRHVSVTRLGGTYLLSGNKLTDYRLDGDSPFGFRWVRQPAYQFDQTGVRFQYHTLVAPYWAAALLTAILPAYKLVGLSQQNRRRRANRCAWCGYDLRATPDRCPECGTMPAGTKVKT